MPLIFVHCSAVVVYSRSRRTCGLIQSHFTTMYENIYTNINKKMSQTSTKHVCHISGRKNSVDIGKNPRNGIILGFK